ncbi:MAG: tRNA (adenosine(37)-N6)-threonylcarbamoyltransferase complex ATPase subunit type 1 TsaE, partial [Clostridia bacterium]
GAGKTVFAKGVISAFSKAMVVSPTFTLVNQYKGKKNVNHFDLYRIENADELENIGASELLFGDSISLVEWPSRKQDWPQTVKKVNIIKSGENERTIIFE